MTGASRVTEEWLRSEKLKGGVHEQLVRLRGDAAEVLACAVRQGADISGAVPSLVHMLTFIETEMVKNAAEALSGYVGDDPARVNQLLDALGGRRLPGLDLSKLSRDRDCYFGGPISDVMWEIGELCETVYGTHSDGSKYGMTYPWRQEQGVEYARDQGYSTASVVRWRGGEYNKWDAIDAEIRADRPVILLVNAEGWGFPNHYPVIEASVYVERRGYDAIGYLANFGWSDSFAPRWFYSRPTSYDPHQSVYDAYFLRF